MAAASTNAPGFDDHFEHAEVNIFRLETLQCYGNAGEDIGIVPVPPGSPWPCGLPQRKDFWMFDFSVLYSLRYHPDGSWIAAEQVIDRAAIQQARRWRETAIQLAKPWRIYIDLHPELAKIVPTGEPGAP